MFYNKDLFAKAGVPFPKKGWTRYDFRDTARKLTEAKNHRWGFGIDNITWNWHHDTGTALRAGSAPARSP